MRREAFETTPSLSPEHDLDRESLAIRVQLLLARITGDLALLEQAFERAYATAAAYPRAPLVFLDGDALLAPVLRAGRLQGLDLAVLAADHRCRLARRLNQQPRLPSAVELMVAASEGPQLLIRGYTLRPLLAGGAGEAPDDEVSEAWRVTNPYGVDACVLRTVGDYEWFLGELQAGREIGATPLGCDRQLASTWMREEDPVLAFWLDGAWRADVREMARDSRGRGQATARLPSKDVVLA